MKCKILKYTNKNGREENQDCYSCDVFGYGNHDKMVSLIVADGMGGKERGDYISRMTAMSFRAFLARKMDELLYKQESLSHSQVRAMMEEGLIYTHNRVSDLMEEKNISGGSTLTAAVIRNNVLNLINVGDSPCYLIRGEEKEIRLISDVQNLARKKLLNGSITDRDSEDYAYYSSFLTNFVGYTDFRMVAAAQYHIFPGDILILGSDGAFGSLKEEEICRLLLEERWEDSIEAITDRARQYGETDNQTLLICKVLGEE